VLMPIATQTPPESTRQNRLRAGERSRLPFIRAGDVIIMQIAHDGRNSHSSLRPDGSVPVAPSAIFGKIPALTRDFQRVKADRAKEARNGAAWALVLPSLISCLLDHLPLLGI
jgi:hypothetical protein